MSNADAVNQDSNIQIPRRGQCMAQTIDTTARKIDLRLLAFNNLAYREGRKEPVFLNLLNESATATIYFYATNDTGAADLDNNAFIAAGGTPALTNSHCYALLPLGQGSFRIFRDVDFFLVVKGSAASTLRLAVTSDSERGLY